MSEDYKVPDFDSKKVKAFVKEQEEYIEKEILNQLLEKFKEPPWLEDPFRFGEKYIIRIQYIINLNKTLLSKVSSKLAKISSEIKRWYRDMEDLIASIKADLVTFNPDFSPSNYPNRGDREDACRAHMSDHYEAMRAITNLKSQLTEVDRYIGNRYSIVRSDEQQMKFQWAMIENYRQMVPAEDVSDDELAKAIASSEAAKAESNKELEDKMSTALIDLSSETPATKEESRDKEEPGQKPPKQEKEQEKEPEPKQKQKTESEKQEPKQEQETEQKPKQEKVDLDELLSGLEKQIIKEPEQEKQEPKQESSEDAIKLLIQEPEQKEDVKPPPQEEQQGQGIENLIDAHFKDIEEMPERVEPTVIKSKKQQENEELPPPEKDSGVIDPTITIEDLLGS